MQIGSERPADVRAAVEPHKSGLNKDGAPDKNGKYLAYSKGVRTPNTALIEQAERQIPGSSGAFNHPIWIALGKGGSIAPYARLLVNGLAGNVRDLMFTRRNELRVELSDIYLRSLVKIGTLDSLAALTILFRLNLARRNSADIWVCSTAIFQVLVLLMPLFKPLGLANLLYYAYARKLFCFATHDGYTREWEKYPFEEAAIHFWRVATDGPPEEARSKKLLKQEVLKAIEKVPSGRTFNLMPLYVPDCRLGPPTEAGALILRQIAEIAKGDSI